MDYASADYFTRTEGRTTGDNLVITLAGGGTITIVNYFDETGTAAGTGYIETIDFWNTQNITITTLINNGWIQFNKDFPSIWSGFSIFINFKIVGAISHKAPFSSL